MEMSSSNQKRGRSYNHSMLSFFLFPCDGQQQTANFIFNQPISTQEEQAGRRGGRLCPDTDTDTDTDSPPQAKCGRVVVDCVGDYETPGRQQLETSGK